MRLNAKGAPMSFPVSGALTPYFCAQESGTKGGGDEMDECAVQARVLQGWMWVLQGWVLQAQEGGEGGELGKCVSQA